MTSAQPRPLRIAACLKECRWVSCAELHGGLPLFACASCGSEWTIDEAWTPIDADGTIPDAVQRERLRGAG